MAHSDERDGFDEFGAAFQSAPTLDTYSAIYRQVLAAYDYRCALTGQQFGLKGLGVQSELRLVAIWPREEGGPLHIGNYLPLCADAANAFRAGHFIVTDTYAVIPDRSVMDPVLASRLAKDGQLLQPGDPLYAADRILLAHHRAAVLRR